MRGVVTNVGGGVVRIGVDRDTMSYPTVGSRVHLSIEPAGAGSYPPATLLTAVDAVRAVHVSRTMIDGYGMAAPYCVECRQVWPCATITAIDDTLAVDAVIVDDDVERPF